MGVVWRPKTQRALMVDSCDFLGYKSKKIKKREKNLANKIPAKLKMKNITNMNYVQKHHILYIKHWYTNTNIPYILYILYIYVYISIPTKIHQSSSYWSV